MKASFSHLHLGIRRKPCTTASFSRIMDAIWIMLGFQRNIVFLRVNGASVAEKSWLACATVSGVVALAWKLRAPVWTDGSGWLFPLLWWCCAIAKLHVLRHFVQWNCCIEEMRSLLGLLQFEGRLARQLRFHLLNSWNLKEKHRTTASFSPLELVEFEGSLARQLRFHESWMRFES